MQVKLIVIGHLGRDCSVKIVNGSNAITFPIASTEKWKNKDGVQMENTTWVECTLWRKPEASTIATYLKKGTLVKVEGRPEARAWKAKSSDEIKSGLTLRIDDLLLLGGPKTSGANTAAPVTENNAAENTAAAPVVPTEEDLPF